MREFTNEIFTFDLDESKGQSQGHVQYVLITNISYFFLKLGQILLSISYNKSCTGFRSTNLHLTLAHFEYQWLRISL